MAMLLLAPVAARRGGVDPLAMALAYGAYGIGHLVCHQLTDRSFQIMSLALPVCARCTGIYAGAALGALVGLARGRARQGRIDARRLLIAAAAPTMATLLYEWVSGEMPSHWVRAAAGAPLGAAVAWIIREVN
jgi:hypothetical protein